MVITSDLTESKLGENDPQLDDQTQYGYNPTANTLSVDDMDALNAQLDEISKSNFRIKALRKIKNLKPDAIMNMAGGEC